MLGLHVKDTITVDTRDVKLIVFINHVIIAPPTLKCRRSELRTRSAADTKPSFSSKHNSFALRFQTWRPLKGGWRSMSPVYNLLRAGGEVSSDCDSMEQRTCTGLMSCCHWRHCLLLSIHQSFTSGWQMYIIAVYCFSTFFFSDSDRRVCLYSYWSLELVNRSRYTEGKA